MVLYRPFTFPFEDSAFSVKKLFLACFSCLQYSWRDFFTDLHLSSDLDFSHDFTHLFLTILFLIGATSFKSFVRSFSKALACSVMQQLSNILMLLTFSLHVDCVTHLRFLCSTL